ncbi:MAG: hypothetical protein RRC07_14925 [Anaerolineae bacterium]|nr:hypothetical protein [Anaerolineae bacterium]
MALNHRGQGVSNLQLTCKAVGFLALLTALLYIRAGLVEGFAFAGLGSAGTSVWLIFALMVAGAVGLFMAWWNERAGGAVALASGILIAVLFLVFATDNALLAAAAYSSPFIIAGFLFYMAGCRR